MNELDSEDVRKTLTEYLGKHKSKLILVGVVLFGISFVFQSFIPNDILLTLNRAVTFLFIIIGLIENKKKSQYAFANV